MLQQLKGETSKLKDIIAVCYRISEIFKFSIRR
jgi:hypothetical protein